LSYFPTLVLSSDNRLPLKAKELLWFFSTSINYKLQFVGKETRRRNFELSSIIAPQKKRSARGKSITSMGIMRNVTNKSATAKCDSIKFMGLLVGLLKWGAKEIIFISTVRGNQSDRDKRAEEENTHSPVNAVENITIPNRRYYEENGKADDCHNVPVVELHLNGQRFVGVWLVPQHFQRSLSSTKTAVFSQNAHGLCWKRR